MIILVFLVTFKLLFLAFPAVVLSAAREGLLLWFHNIIPALLPFMVVSNMLTTLGFAHFLGKRLAPVMEKIFGVPGAGGLALIVGLTSGYPIGAKTVADLHKTGEISNRQAQHLLAFCNNAGPLFILGVVGAGFFQNIAVGYILLAGHMLSAMTTGVALRPFFCRGKSGAKNIRDTAYSAHQPSSGPGSFFVPMTGLPQRSVDSALGSAVKNAMESITVIGGLVIFFNTVPAVLTEIGFPDSGIAAGLVTAAIEVTNGLHILSRQGATYPTLALAAFAIAFGGFSIHAQTLHFTEGTKIKPTLYILSKLLHGALAAVFTIFICLIADFAVK